MSVTAYADSAGFSNTEEQVLAVKTPYDSKYTAVQWNTEKSDDVGIPLTEGAHVYLPADSRILKLNEADGSLAAELTLAENICTDFSGAVTGNTLVQPTENGIAVINTSTMTVTESLQFDGKASGSCAISDGLLYTSYIADGNEVFLCLDMHNGLETVWQYNGTGALGDATRYGDYILFSQQGGSLVSHHYKEDSYSVINVGSEICSTPFASQYAVFFTTSDGYAVKLRLNDDGTMEEDTLSKCNVGANPSAALSWNGRLYVGSDTGFHILDDLNMEIVRSYDYIAGCSDPIVTLGNGSRVYIVAPENEKWTLYSIYDIDDLEEPQISKLALLEDFTNGDVSVSDNGTMFFCDAFGRLYALVAVGYSFWNMAIRIVLVLALVVCVFIWLRAMRKKKENKPQY